jgi:hypothetical protein
MDTTSLLVKVDAGISDNDTTFRFAKGRALTLLRPLGSSGDAYPFAGGFESIYLNQEGGSFQHEIVDDDSFGPMQDIAYAIVERTRTFK